MCSHAQLFRNGLDWESKGSLRWTFLMTAMNFDSRGSRVLLNQLGTWLHFQQDGCSWIFLLYNRSARGRKNFVGGRKIRGTNSNQNSGCGRTSLQ